ncbi:Cell division protein BolA [hydrothermal vent metagenome]|uniref:Cell division protein BolA n=1 Tax=hydrothermal vent metagenome TaxID=652676 RepID=A0A3B0RMH1_9ZZZZ
MCKMANNIRKKLQARFSPEQLEVLDQSHLHAGHAGAREGGGSHFAVTIKASAFTGLTPLARHRAINNALAEEFCGEQAIHALTIKASGV